MKGCKLETIEESWNPTKLNKYLDWELHNIQSCRSDGKIKSRIFQILNLGIELETKYNLRKQK